MKLKDKQSIFDAVIHTYGDLSGLADILANNNELFQESYVTNASPINHEIVNYFKDKILTTY